ncbi:MULTISPECIES: K(+)-transporting ATPase subunit C [Roseomonadaceae]|uniref:Potassium-transporting ATPase KdpC subunit n=1 Tax=Falsiroseomonas oleicola TaxID=2801474 RepID=A0ABS6H755_9PROT|nr:K(+)-transporting ATPase subunit C [Roseomonas oleicola]MBU8544289.1 K(+)-transporting ATPase subunit C [Roseomonas oleicola]
MWNLLRPALVMLGGFTLLLGLIVPLGFTGVAQALFPQAANGSLIVQEGRVVGSDLIARRMEGPAWFQPRASGSDTGAAPSNLGPTSAALLEAVRARAEGQRDVPADAATASGSGLDPHVSPANAARQAAWVAEARGLPRAQVEALVDRHTEGRLLGFLGEPRVNVLRLNLALGAP